MIETDHQNFFLIGLSQCFSVKSLKGDWDKKCFQDNKNFEIVIYRISFTFCFAKFQLVLIGRSVDMVP